MFGHVAPVARRPMMSLLLLFGLSFGFPVLHPLVHTSSGAWRVHSTGYQPGYSPAWEVSIVSRYAGLLNRIRYGEHRLSERICALCAEGQSLKFPREENGVVDDNVNR